MVHNSYTSHKQHHDDINVTTQGPLVLCEMVACIIILLS